MPPVDRNKPIRAASSDSRYSLMEFMADFPDDATCLDWLWRTRYSADGEHAFCPRCQTERVFKRYATKQGRQSWTCNGCGLHVHPTAGTIFHKSSTSLHLWFYAMYLMTSTRCGISAKQLERELGVNYKTAHRMFRRIREELMTQNDEPLSGTIEADEMYLAGKPRNKDRREWAQADELHRQSEMAKWIRRKQQTVFGMVEREGEVRAYVVPSNQGRTLLPHIETRVLPESVVYTDEAMQYRSLPKRGYEHKRVHHKARVYVDGDVHTNTIEGFWALVKGGLKGVYHSVSAKHLQSYLNEYAWRYNNRQQDGRAMFLTLILRAAQPT